MPVSLTPELYCTNIKISLSFYVEVLGFKIEYQREEERFAMLERQGARIMLEEIGGTNRVWLADKLEYPFGRGINLEIKTDKIEALYENIQKRSIAFFLPLEEKQYRINDSQLINLQFIILDPDGYLLRFSQTIASN